MEHTHFFYRSEAAGGTVLESLRNQKFQQWSTHTFFTDLKQQVEQTEPQAGELIQVEVFILPFLLNTRKSMHTSSNYHQKGKKRQSYQETINVIFPSCLFEVWDD